MKIAKIIARIEENTKIETYVETPLSSAGKMLVGRELLNESNYNLGRVQEASVYSRFDMFLARATEMQLKTLGKLNDSELRAEDMFSFTKKFDEKA